MDALPVVADALVQTAPAKVNLSLQIVGRRADGYHLLDSIVVFCAVGDRLTINEAGKDSLRIVGPMAGALAGGSNILETTLGFARRIAEENGVRIGPLALRLEKNLPVAAGIGGGSADAAALLRALGTRHPDLADAFRAESLQLGADVPMCLRGEASHVTGIGEIVLLLDCIPAVPIVLANPGAPLSTPAVFARFTGAPLDPAPPPPPGGFAQSDTLFRYLAACRNDLQSAATAVVPAIADAITQLRSHGATIARMSGSGATTFGLFRTVADATAAAASLSTRNPGWWVAATTTFPASRRTSP